MNQVGQKEVLNFKAKVAASPLNTIVLVMAQYANHFRSVPQDGRTYCVQDQRRPWVNHITYPDGKYRRVDERNAKFWSVTTSVTRNGKRVELHSYSTKKTAMRLAGLTSSDATSTTTETHPLDVCLVDLHRVMAITGFKKSFIYEQISVDFPSPIRLGNSRRSAARWVQSEVVAWVQTQIDKRTPQNTTL